MNRGKLEDWAVRLYMLSNRNRIHKSRKPEALLMMQIKVTKVLMTTLEAQIEEYLTALEVR